MIYVVGSVIFISINCICMSSYDVDAGESTYCPLQLCMC